MRKADNPREMEEDKRMNQEVIMQTWTLVTKKEIYCNLTDMHWVLPGEWPCHTGSSSRVAEVMQDDWNTLDKFMKGWVLDADHQSYAGHQKDFVLKPNLLYLTTMQGKSSEIVLAFVVPPRKRQVTIDVTVMRANRAMTKKLACWRKYSGGQAWWRWCVWGTVGAASCSTPPHKFQAGVVHHLPQVYGLGTYWLSEDGGDS